MLKIIDDFDLKGLEEFGFENLGWTYCKDEPKDENVGLYVRGDKTICYSCSMNKDINEMSILYDLIQAGIVEKI